MAISLDAFSLVVELHSRLKNPLDNSTPIDEITYRLAKSLSAGAGDDAGNIHWHDTRSLNATTSEELDLTALAATGGAFGTVAFGDVRFLLIINLDTEGNIEIGAASATVWAPPVKDDTDIIVIGKDGFFLWGAPKDAAGVVDATNKLLKINNVSAGTQEYFIFLVGTT